MKHIGSPLVVRRDRDVQGNGFGNPLVDLIHEKQRIFGKDGKGQPRSKKNLTISSGGVDRLGAYLRTLN